MLLFLLQLLLISAENTQCGAFLVPAVLVDPNRRTALIDQTEYG